MATDLQPCGTRAAYMRHYRAGLRGHQIDDACRKANNEYTKSRRDEGDNETHKLYVAAQWRARRDLSERYPDEYEELFQQYLDALRRGSE